MTALNQLEVVKKETGEVVHVPQRSLPANTPLSPFGSIEAFETAQRMAKALAASTFIPKEFRGNLGDCLILLETASRTNMPIMALMQSMYIVHGKPSFSSAFMAGLINNSKRFDAPLRFEYNEDTTSCYAHTTKDGQEYRGITVTMEMAQKEGWSTKSGSKWKTMPQLMLQYRATSFFARAYCADLIMGMKEQTEVEDEIVVTETKTNTNLNTIVSPTEEEKEQAIDVEVEEVVEKQPDPEVTTVFENLQEEAKEKKTASDLDQWRMKHANRIAKVLEAKEDQDRFFAWIEELYQGMVANETGSVDCPNGKGNVQKTYCNSECDNRSGCPSFE